MRCMPARGCAVYHDSMLFMAQIRPLATFITLSFRRSLKSSRGCFSSSLIWRLLDLGEAAGAVVKHPCHLATFGVVSRRQLGGAVRRAIWAELQGRLSYRRRTLSCWRQSLASRSKSSDVSDLLPRV